MRNGPPCEMTVRAPHQAPSITSSTGSQRGSPECGPLPRLFRSTSSCHSITWLVCHHASDARLAVDALAVRSSAILSHSSGQLRREFANLDSERWRCPGRWPSCWARDCPDQRLPPRRCRCKQASQSQPHRRSSGRAADGSLTTALGSVAQVQGQVHSSSMADPAMQLHAARAVEVTSDRLVQECCSMHR